jgi:hypothetical protein
MHIDVVTAAITRLEAQGKRVSVRAIHAITGGSFRDIVRNLQTLRPIEAAEDSVVHDNAHTHAQPGPNARHHALTDMPARRYRQEKRKRSVASSTPEESLFPEITEPKKLAFLVAFFTCGICTRAAKIAHVEVRNHGFWLHKDPMYAAAFERAKRLANDRLEDEIYRRGVEGVDKPVFYQGKKVGTVREYSDLLLIFGTKGAMPEKYRERTETRHEFSPAMQALYDEWHRLRDHPEEGNTTRPALGAFDADWAPAYMPGLDEEGPAGAGPYDEDSDDDYDGGS